MKLIIHQSGGRPIEINTDRVRVVCGQDHWWGNELAKTRTRHFYTGLR